MGRYKGSYRPVVNGAIPGNMVMVKVEPKDIYQLTRIFEGYSHLGWAVPFDAQGGIVGIHTTADNYSEVLKVLANMDISHQVIK